ncbi:Putative uncharacterized protein [Desulfurococcus amylolyticus 1221n]|uniref:DUF72 domain-containing protein n=1 Tax=Desulfurococcus amylolyticus (strain DSM 18924 / JCM 16383 / VKM B-2413 / 1221n) TaxID=490899 RepID=B8D482_DESA1|nr:DUF72 domain-containing protein [Desulfurococcus amylolyticus]ACL10913.1 Putative uncharacterized protein [Desulfurococcus amylolyticus 1221n]
MEVYVGTSGWLYDWNEEASLDWYIRESGLNAVELNASFYRFPYRNQVVSWARKGRGIRWSIKVHKSITHYRKLGRDALEIWRRFHNLFTPMNDVIDFYLFQMPPQFTCSKENLEKIERFHDASNLASRMAVEFRHVSCFNDGVASWGIDKSIVIVSIDAPIASWITNIMGIVYLRMHGRSSWYGHEYTMDELREVAGRIVRMKPEKVYVFFNNDHWMLENARSLMGMLRG